MLMKTLFALTPKILFMIIVTIKIYFVVLHEEKTCRVFYYLYSLISTHKTVQTLIRFLHRE